jgi:hypothetical protein
MSDEIETGHHPDEERCSVISPFVISFFPAALPASVPTPCAGAEDSVTVYLEGNLEAHLLCQLTKGHEGVHRADASCFGGEIAEITWGNWS